MKLCCRRLFFHRRLPKPGAVVACVSRQVPGVEDQTALSLEECLRLLEATFPFGENSEVSEDGVVVLLVPPIESAGLAVNWVRLFKEAPGIVPAKVAAGGGCGVVTIN